MAPRKKRTTTKSSKPKRGRPKLPEGNLDTSMSAEDLEIKLKNYIEDYQLQGSVKLKVRAIPCITICVIYWQ
jgi:hypothetical protein